MKLRLSYIWLIIVTVYLSGCSSSTDPNTLIKNQPKALEKIVKKQATLEREYTVKLKNAFSKKIDYSDVVDISGDKLYAIDAFGVLYAFNLNTGEKIWLKDFFQKKRTFLERIFINNIMPTIISNIEVLGNRLFFGTIDGYVYAIDLDDNQSIIWKKNLASEVLALTTFNNQLYVRLSNGAFVALDNETGKDKWLVKVKPSMISLRGVSDPILINNESIVVGFDDTTLMALDTNTGKEYWKKRISFAVGDSEIDNITDIDGKPLYFNNKLFVTSFNGDIQALDPLSGNIYWKKSFSSYSNLVVIYNYLLGINDQSTLYTFYPDNGKVLWENNELSFRNLTEPVVVGDFIIVGDLKGFLHILSADSGELVGRQKISKSAIRFLKRHENWIVAFTEDSRIHVLKLVTNI